MEKEEWSENNLRCFRRLSERIDVLVGRRLELLRRIVEGTDAWKEYLAYPDWGKEPRLDYVFGSLQGCELSPTGKCVFDVINDPQRSCCLFCGEADHTEDY